MVNNTITPLPRTGRDRIDHAKRIVEILENNQYGLTIIEVISELYGGTLPSEQPRQQYEVEEFKRSYQYCNEQFNAHKPGWVWIRTRKIPQHDWIYMAVAKMCNNNAVRMIDAAVSYDSYLRYESEWQTRTKTLTRMQIMDIEARKAIALMNGNVEAAKIIESELDNLKIVSPRLGLMYFGSGLMDENLEILENDPRARLINKQIKEVRGNMKKLQNSTAKLSHNIEGLLRLRGVI